MTAHVNPKIYTRIIHLYFLASALCSPRYALRFTLSALHSLLSALWFLPSALHFLLSAFCFPPSALYFLFCLLLCLTSCSTRPSDQKDTNSVKYQQYYLHGQLLYINHCSNCHQKNGKGLGLLFPPVDQSDFIDKNFEEVVCIIRNGIKGDIVVNGNHYNKEMPAIPSLTDLEIAEITTYLYNTWGRDRGIVEVQDASAILAKCGE